MKSKLLFKLMIIFIPYFLYAQLPISVLTKSTQATEQVQEKTENSQNQSEEDVSTKKTIEESLNEQIEKANEIIKKINDESYLNQEFDKKEYDNKINYYLNRININERAGNTIAVKRDEIQLLTLQEKRTFDLTLINIINGKNSFKNKNYFTKIINDNIKFLNDNSIDKYEDLYNASLKDKNSKVSQEYINAFLELQTQSSQQLFTLNYLLNNMSKYRKTNFFIDEFNLNYVINTIDSQPVISNISAFTTYYLKFSIGDLVVVLLILTFFKLINTHVVTLFTALLNKMFIRKKKDDEKEEEENNSDEEKIEFDFEEAINGPLIVTLYTLAIQISAFILIKDEEVLNTINPWINTLYMALLTWALYSILTDAIAGYAQHLVSKYPNVRKEMITFILRIVKVILVLLVILFLFSQLGIDIKAIAASLGVGGIAIALAAKDTLTNFFGSLSIMTDNSFSQGDWIVAGDVEGTVVDIRMRTTRIRTFDNAMITVTNSTLANANIKNYSKRKIGRRINFSVGITYESDMKDIYNLKKDIQEMLMDHPHIATEKNSILSKSKRYEVVEKADLLGVKRTLLVYIDEYGPSSINILIYCFTRSPNWEDWLTVKEDVIMRIAELVKKNNCDFAYPTQTLLVKNENIVKDTEKKELVQI